MAVVVAWRRRLGADKTVEPESRRVRGNGYHSHRFSNGQIYGN